MQLVAYMSEAIGRLILPEAWEARNQPGDHGLGVRSRDQAMAQEIAEYRDLFRLANACDLPALAEPVGYYCNRCGKFPEASEHRGCDYLATGIPRGLTVEEARAYARKAVALALAQSRRDAASSQGYTNEPTPGL